MILASLVHFPCASPTCLPSSPHSQTHKLSIKFIPPLLPFPFHITRSSSLHFLSPLIILLSIARILHFLPPLFLIQLFITLIFLFYSYLSIQNALYIGSIYSCISPYSSLDGLYNIHSTSSSVPSIETILNRTYLYFFFRMALLLQSFMPPILPYFSFST